MAIEIKVQRDFLRTEASITLPANVSDVDEIMRATKTNGKMVVLYNQGYVQGINIEQNTKVPEGKSEEIRQILNVETKEI
jgi:hypothetical protein